MKVIMPVSPYICFSLKKSPSLALADKLGYTGPISTGLPHACCLDLYSLAHKEFLYRISSYQMPLLSPMSLCMKNDLAKGMTERIWTTSAESQWFYSLHLVPRCQDHCCCLLFTSGSGSTHPPACHNNALWTTISVCRCSMDRKYLGDQLPFFNWGIFKRLIRNNTKCILLPKFEKVRKTQWTYRGVVSTPTEGV